MRQGHIGMRQGHVGMRQGHIGMRQGHIGMRQGAHRHEAGAHRHEAYTRIATTIYEHNIYNAIISHIKKKFMKSDSTNN